MSTIAAIVTAPGNAAVSIIRISGSESWPIIEKLGARGSGLKANEFKLSWLYDCDQKIEQAMTKLTHQVKKRMV